MKVMVAGASGAIGRQLIPLLQHAGHQVCVLQHQTAVLTGDVEVRAADVLDRDGLVAALHGLEPDVVVNLLTAIPAQLNPRKFAQQFARTNLLRSQGTANLIAATNGARMVSEGLAYAYSPEGGPLANEDRPLWLTGPKPFRPTAATLVELEHLTQDTGGTVLRFGHLSGPGTIFASDGSLTAQVRAGKAPIVGDGRGVFSFTHVHDAATAVVAAIGRPDVTGPLNIVNDEPAQVKDWLPQFAELVGGPRPKSVPYALARLASGPWGAAYMNRLVGADNGRARLLLEWRPRYRTALDSLSNEVPSPRLRSCQGGE